MSAKIRLVLVDDHTIVRRGLNLLFKESSHIEIVGEAKGGEEALEIVKNVNPDVIITDITMPGINGIQLIRLLSKSHPNLSVIVLSMHLDHDYVVSAMNAGAKGYVSKDDEADDIIKAVHKVGNGETYITSSVSHLLAMKVIKRGKKTKSILTLREQEILNRIVNGDNVKESMLPTLFL